MSATFVAEDDARHSKMALLKYEKICKSHHCVCHLTLRVLTGRRYWVSRKPLLDFTKSNDNGSRAASEMVQRRVCGFAKTAAPFDFTTPHF
jgi:hypothetical protein